MFMGSVFKGFIVFPHMTLSRGVIGPVTLEYKGSTFPLNLSIRLPADAAPRARRMESPLYHFENL